MCYAPKALPELTLCICVQETSKVAAVFESARRPSSAQMCVIGMSMMMAMNNKLRKNGLYYHL